MDIVFQVIRDGKVIPQDLVIKPLDIVDISAFAVTPVTVKNGDTLRVYVSFKYYGLAQDITLYGAVGIDPSGANIGLYGGTSSTIDFDEALVGERTISVPAKTEAQNYTHMDYVDIPIVVSWDASASIWSGLFRGFDGSLQPANSYDLYVKVKEHSSVMNKQLGVVNLSSEGASGTQSAFSGIGSLIGGLIAVMMLGMMMEMMGSMDTKEPFKRTPENPAPITNIVIGGAKKGAEYAGKAIKRITEYYNEAEE